MSNGHPRAPPLAGRPPYATDEPDYIYDSSQQPQQRRLRQQQPPADPNARSSAYDLYDDYLADEKGGQPQPQQQYQQQRPQQPIAAPQPGYAAPIAALNLARPPPAMMMPPSSHHHQQGGNPFQTPPPMFPTPPSPTAPHPLQPPSTPIQAQFIRPSTPSTREVKFKPGNAPIMRGNSEETLIPKRGERGDDFWKRFSMIAKDEDTKKPSSWLKKTESGTKSLSATVWIIGIILLLCIGGASGLAWWKTHDKSSHTQPTAFGGSANERPVSSDSIGVSTTKHASGVGGVAASSSPHVSPTNTVARRYALPDPVPTAFGSPIEIIPTRQRRHVNRAALSSHH